MNLRNLNPILSIILLCTIFGVISCTEDRHSGNLAESELYFQERLSSISAEGDSAFWIGSETGDIWYMNKKISRSYNIGTDRIYKVVTDSVYSQSRICWISSRNSGLQKWLLNDTDARLLNHYPIKNKGINYSVYDILLTDNQIFLATSQGLYTMCRSGKEELDLVYPPETSETAHSGSPFIINNICGYLPNYLLCATPKGLLKMDYSSGKVEMSHVDEQIYKVSVYGDNVYVLANSRLYIENIEGDRIKTVELPFSPRIYYRAGGVHYFLNDTYLRLSNDLKSFFTIPLRRKVPQFCTNVIAANPTNGNTLLITENALWSIPIHLGTFNKYGEIVASCSNGNDFYYVTSTNNLYYQSKGSAHAFKIFEFSEHEVVSRLMADEEYLYYICNDHILKRIKLNKRYVRNMLCAFPETVYQSPTKITAFCLSNGMNGSIVYLGIQDDLIRIDANGNAELVDALHNKYITSFYQPLNTDNIYISTLNDGVFYGNGKSFQVIENTKNNKFIRNLSATDGYQRMLIILTNHQLVCKEFGDSIALKGYKKIFNVNDSLIYALPESGLVKYLLNYNQKKISEEGRYFCDIRFNPDASLLMEDTLYLGSNIGVLKVGTSTPSPEKWVDMEATVFSFKLFVIIVAFVLIIMFILVGEYFKRKRSRRTEAKAYLEDIGERLNSLSSIVCFAGENDEKEIDKLKNLFYSIQLDAPDFKKQIKSLSEQIMRKNRDMALALSKHLEKQILMIGEHEAFERTALIERSRAALDTGDLERIVSQIEQNEKWINKISELRNRMTAYNSDMENTVCIETVNGGFIREMYTLTDDIKRMELSDLETEIKRLDEDYAYIFTDEALKMIDRYIQEKEEKLRRMEVDHVIDALIAELENVRAEMVGLDRIKLLKILYPIDCHITQLIVKQEIASLMDMYSSVRNKVEKENEERITKKFDTSLNDEIAEKTRFVTEQIQKQIAVFYAYMVKTDKEVLINLLGLSNFNGQSAKVLALLISNPKVKRLHIPGMLCLYGNLNPVISRLMNTKLKVHYHSLCEYTRENPTSIVSYILHLVD